MRHIVKPPQLRLPTDTAIRRCARYEEVRDLQPVEYDLIKDLLCRATGAPLATVDWEVENQAAHEYADRTTPIILAEYDARLDDPWVDDCQLSRTEVHDQQRDHFRTDQADIRQLLEEFELNRVPGCNDLQRAIRLIKLIRLIRQIHYHWIRMALVMVVVIDGLDAMDAVKAEGLSDLLLRSEEEQQQSEPEDMDELQRGLELLVQEVHVEEMLRVSRQLKELSALASPEVEITPNPDGDDARIRDIQELSEIGRVGSSAFGLPDDLLMHRALNGELDVTEPVIRCTPKQLLYLLVDATGSMRGLPVSRAAGVVHNRLRAVIDGDAEVYLRLFDTALGEAEYHADSPASARELMAVIENPMTYSGGGTDFHGPLQAASVRVQELVDTGAFHHPEVMMVTDGEATIPDQSALGGLRLHTIQVGSKEVLELGSLARASGGINVFVTSDHLRV